MNVKPKSKPNQKETPTFNDKSCDRELFFSQEIMEVEFKAKYNFGPIIFSFKSCSCFSHPRKSYFPLCDVRFYMSTDPAI